MNTRINIQIRLRYNIVNLIVIHIFYRIIMKLYFKKNILRYVEFRSIIALINFLTNFQPLPKHIYDPLCENLIQISLLYNNNALDRSRWPRFTRFIIALLILLL